MKNKKKKRKNGTFNWLKINTIYTAWLTTIVITNASRTLLKRFGGPDYASKIHLQHWIVCVVAAYWTHAQF